MKRVSDKIIVLTGASSGIGLATAQRLAKSGCRVYGVARRPFSAETFECFQADVTDLPAVERVLEQVFEREGRIDAVINNAGMGIAGAVEYATPESIKRIFDTNLTALAEISSVAVKYLKKSKGNLINIGSVAGQLPIPFQSCYSATKAGVLNFSLALGNEVKRFGVKVTCIQPGDTKTGFTAARVVEGGEADYGGRIGRSVKRMEHDEQNGKDPDTVAKAVVRALGKKRPPLKITVGGQYKLFVGLAKLLPTRFVNFILRKLYA